MGTTDQGAEPGVGASSPTPMARSGPGSLDRAHVEDQVVDLVLDVREAVPAAASAAAFTRARLPLPRASHSPQTPVSAASTRLKTR